MSDEISMPVEFPLDSDGFLRRECPSCEREFKWLHTPEGSSYPTDQYFCPLCGVAAGPDSWWTKAQIEHIRAAVMPEIGRAIQDSFERAARSSKFLQVKRGPASHVHGDDPDPLVEPDDMVIVEPPCHPDEPLKVPAESTGQVHCLICGDEFTA